MGAVIPIIVQELPDIIALIKSAHAAANPGAPPLTDDQVHAGLLMVASASLAKDDTYFASQPTSDQ